MSINSNLNTDFKNNFAVSSFDNELALQCNFPPEKFKFQGGRHEVSAFTKIMALRRFPSESTGITSRDGKPNSTFICPRAVTPGQCGNMVVNFSQTDLRNIVKKSNPCLCEFLPHPENRSCLVEKVYSSVWDMQAAVVGFFYGVLKVPVVCIASKGPSSIPPNVGRGKGFWLKKLDGAWLFLPYTVSKKNKTTTYMIRKFPEDHELDAGFIQESTLDTYNRTSSITFPSTNYNGGEQAAASTASLPTQEQLQGTQDVLSTEEESIKYCSICQDGPGHFRFVCTCPDNSIVAYCRDCLETMVTTRKTQNDPMERDNLLLYYDQYKKASAITCNMNHAVTHFYPIGSDPKTHAMRCSFPVGWLYKRPFFTERDLRIHLPVFTAHVQPIREEIKQIQQERADIQAQKLAHRENMVVQYPGWTNDATIDNWDRLLEVKHNEVAKKVFPKWAEHPSTYTDASDGVIPKSTVRLVSPRKQPRLEEQAEIVTDEVIDLSG